MRTPERELAAFITRLHVDDVPADTQQVVRRMILAVCGTAFAGAAEDGIASLRSMLLEAGGTGQATTFIHGDRLPAAVAAQFNGTLCRALDFCDALAPGPHNGAAVFPAALAAAELVGGCDGPTFMAALAAGTEVGVRFNLSEAQYDGFDPTGIAVVFAAAAAASRIMRLTEAQTVHALALAFNRCGGSFQSHVDGSLGVRVLQGWVAHAGVQCAQMARLGITGPENFLAGHYGFAHLYGRDTLDPAQVVRGLGEEWQTHRIVFKKYPSCGVTQGVTELALGLLEDADIRPDDIRRVAVRLPPYAHRLVGHPFQLGANPRVDAQFSAAYCVANALVRRSSGLAHFDALQVRDPIVTALIDRIDVVADAALDARGHTSVDLDVTMNDGFVHRRALDDAPGSPGAPLDDAQHRARFDGCLAYAPRKPDAAQVDALLQSIDGLTELDDARRLASMMKLG